MDFEKIKDLVDFILKKEIDEFELETEGLKLKIVKPKQQVQIVTAQASAQQPQQAAPAQQEEKKAQEEIHFITSPMVGTFYRRPDPSSPPYVKEGDHVEKGQVLCIIEAMKVMNEVESDVSGTIKAILVEDAQPVEYGQKLFAIIPD